ncbi:MAG: diguanylate cyclase [Methylococcales bacterium]|nr:diguanylate cyclase [Methylococcales bacterium]
MDRLKQLQLNVLRQQRRLACMFLELNDFKHVDDNCGHEFGVQLLKFVAERLSASVRANGAVARMRVANSLS